MFGQHIQSRSRLVLAVAIASGVLWLGAGFPLPVQAQAPNPATELYVSYIQASWFHTTGSAHQSVAYVDIVDGNGNPVNGARVVGNWSGCFKLNGVSDTTETVCTTADDGTTICVDGRAVISSKRYNCSKNNCSFIFTITGVQKDGMTYVPVAGKTTSSITCKTFAATLHPKTKATWASSRQVPTGTQQMTTRRLARWSRR